MKSIQDLVESVYPFGEDDDDHSPFQSLLSSEGLRETFRPGGYQVPGKDLIQDADTAAWGLITARVHSISHAVCHTCLRNQQQIDQACEIIAGWMRGHEIVRFLGAGRALLATTMPGNRLAHGGAQVSFMGGNVPLPNSERGGGVIACSASGKTRPVLEAMEIAKKHNPAIPIVGFASHDSTEFASLCSIFVGIHTPKSEYPNPLSALADTEEYVIAELLDGIVVLAGRRNGFVDETWRRGHENIGPTGPYAPADHS